jgi:hypothetical protein
VSFVSLRTADRGRGGMDSPGEPRSAGTSTGLVRRPAARSNGEIAGAGYASPATTGTDGST